MIVRKLLTACLCCVALAGCRSDRQRVEVAQDRRLDTGAIASLESPQVVESVHAVARPPIGWTREPLKTSDKHRHQVWLSPSGKTAYGIIYFAMPGIADVLPIPMNWVLDGFLDAMRDDQGEAELLSRQDDPDLPGIRFVAEGGLYTTYTNLITAGRHGWAIYVGTLRSQPDAPDEMDLAEQAREQTRVRIPE